MLINRSLGNADLSMDIKFQLLSDNTCRHMHASPLTLLLDIREYMCIQGVGFLCNHVIYPVHVINAIRIGLSIFEQAVQGCPGKKMEVPRKS